MKVSCCDKAVMDKYKLTIWGLLISLLTYMSTVLFDLELFESTVSALHRFEHLEIDELIIPALILLLFSCLDLRRRHREEIIEKEKVKIYKAMLFSTEHILNNFLNEMQIFKLTAEETEGFDQDVLKLYDEVIHEASAQVDSLGSITHINEDAIQKAVKPR